MGQGARKLTLAERIRLTTRRIESLRAGAGEYHAANREYAIRSAEQTLASLWAEAGKIARAA